MIDPRLQALRVLRAEGTVTATAAVLHLSPPTVSQQLRQLSGELGLKLLEPVGRRVRLTPAALALVEHVEVMNAEWERANGVLDSHREGAAGVLRITGVASALATVIAPAAQRLCEQFPGMACRLDEHPDEDRISLLLSHRVDIAVVIATFDVSSTGSGLVEHDVLIEEPQDLLVPDHHALAGRETVRLSDTAQETWIHAGDPRDQHPVLLHAAAAAGFTPRVTHSAIDWTAVAALVAHGHGICLVPRQAPLPQGLPLRRVPLAGPTAPVRRLLACVRPGSRTQIAIARGLDALQDAALRLAP
ncbi:LysR family transcriptional regulator [Streptomyces bathyalis]|uniref:LysR family transcriptional regulator n=1 Tax=Streptomyces bathyalis TaxID=2710756 RepID=A0A7T1WSH1_9ACTN|nr:LysR family transcriptional regulator [Streptomyces bathyalis]QPP07526.1 LysR family transcriptional regulator [Streptomyces bathyalis]